MSHPQETEGQIRFLSVAALLRDLQLRRATGELAATRGGTVKRVYFRNGTVLFASSSEDGDRLGCVLLAKGMISRECFEESAARVASTGRKQGTVLVEIGALTPKDLFRGLIAQVREIVISLLDWDDGGWRFSEGLPPQEEMVSLRLNPGSLVFEGVLRAAADPRFTRAWDPAGMGLLTPASPGVTLEELDAPVAASRVLALADQGRPFAEMAAAIAGGEREAAALLYTLELFGLVKLTPQAAAPAAAAPAASRAAGPQPAAAAPDPESAPLRERVLSLAASLPSLSLYQLLGLTPESNQDAVKRAYIALAKEYHPDRFFQPGLEDVQAAVNTIFMRVNEAYTTLYNPASRAAYDTEVRRGQSAGARGGDLEQDSRLAQEQFRKGLEMLQNGDVWSAIQSFRWAANLNPQNPRYHAYLGVALTRTRKRLHEAEEHCKTAIALDCNNSQYYVHLGLVYKAGRLLDKARRQFELALRLDPKDPQALRELAELKAEPAERGLMDRLFKK